MALDPLFAQAVLNEESGGDPNAVSSAGAVGQMQTLPSTLADPGYGVKPAQNNSPQERKRVGDDYLAAMHNKYQGDPNLTLIAYNYGPGNTDSWLASGADPRDLPTETQHYVKKINSTYQKLKSQNVNQDAQTDDLMAEYRRPKADADQSSGTSTPSYTTDVDENGRPILNISIPNIHGVAAKSSPPDDLMAEYRQQKSTAKTSPVDKAPTNKQAQVSTPVDILESGVSAIPKAIGALPQVPAMAGNATANALGYLYGRAVGATPEQQNKLNNLNPFYTGNTPIDALDQSLRAVINDNSGPENPLTGLVLHDPQTRGGRIVNALTQASIAGPATAIKMGPSLAAAAGSTAASEEFPGNPLAPVLGGIGAGVANAGLGALKWRPTGEDVAHDIIQQNYKGAGLPENSLKPDPLAAGLAPADVDPNELIPGVKPTLAETTGSPNLAVVQRQRQQVDPSAFAANEAVREAARKVHFEKATGTPQDVQAMEVARENQREADTNAIFKPGQEADPTPVVKKIDEILQGPGGERPAVKNTLNKVREILVRNKGSETSVKSHLLDSSGNPINSKITRTGETYQTNPEFLYRSVQKSIADLLDKKDLTNSEGRQSSRELLQVKEVLDDVINKATPGFQKYLDNYSSASSKIDAARFLQGLKLTDQQGNFTLNKVKTALDNIKKLRGEGGVNEAKAISPEQLKALQTLHDDLKQREKVMAASMPRNSATVQNAIATNALNSGLAAKVGKITSPITQTLGPMLGAGVGSHIPFIGPEIGAFVGSKVATRQAGKQAARAADATSHLQNFLLNPDEYKQYLMNAQNDHYLNRVMNNLLINP